MPIFARAGDAMRIFITGGTGFIGQAVCEALQGHDLRVLTSESA